MTRRSVSVVGATGYSGAELVALLARHPRATIAGLFGGADGAAVPFGSIHPSLRGRQGPAAEPYRPERVIECGAEVVFLATPPETSAAAAPRLLDAGLTVIDLSGAFRLGDAQEFARWYGFAHPCPELLAGAVYGLTEWCDGALAGARLVASPGCYATSVLLAVKPLAVLLEPGAPIICDAASGVSGAGKRAELGYSFTELSGNVSAYGVGTHRHEPEMRRALGLEPGAPFVFVAHLLPIVRGILATIHVSFARPCDAGEVAAAYEAAYGRAPFVRVLPAGSLPDLKEVVGTPRAAIGFVLLEGGRRAVVVSAIDNLLKGAASQAVQNFNRVCGFAEEEGLQ